MILGYFSLFFLCGMFFSHSKEQADSTHVSAPLHKSGSIEYVGKSGNRIEYLQIESGPSITLRACSNITIFGCDLRSITMVNCRNISIQNSWIHDSTENGIFVSNCENITVQGCRIENVSSGLYAVYSATIQFIGNYVENVLGPYPRGQMVQFDKVHGKNNAVKNNYAINYHGRSVPEDMINMFKSAGEASSPIVIEGNYLTGDPDQGSQGKSKTGSGIMLGDLGGRYIICRKNTLINPGQVGIGVAGGDSIRVENNIVFGSRSDVSNVGVYCWNQSDLAGGVVTVTQNRVLWMNKSGEYAHYWQGTGFSKIVVDKNIFGDTPLAKELPLPPSKAPFPPELIAIEKAGEKSIPIPWSK